MADKKSFWLGVGFEPTNQNSAKPELYKRSFSDSATRYTIRYKGGYTVKSVKILVNHTNTCCTSSWVLTLDTSSQRYLTKCSKRTQFNVLIENWAWSSNTFCNNLLGGRAGGRAAPLSCLDTLTCPAGSRSTSKGYPSPLPTCVFT